MGDIRYKMNYDIIDRFELLILESAQECDERRLKEKKEREKKLKEIEDAGHCEYYGQFCNGKDAKWIGAMTRYHWDIDKEPLSDPNRDLFLCDSCAMEYHDYWQERWDDYYSGLL